MSFYIVIYSSLGMSAFWEVVEKSVKLIRNCRFFWGGRWDWNRAGLRVDFVITLGAAGCQTAEKCVLKLVRKVIGHSIIGQPASRSKTFKWFQCWPLVFQDFKMASVLGPTQCFDGCAMAFHGCC